MESSSSLPSSTKPKAGDHDEEEASCHKEIYDQLRQVVSSYPTAPSGMGVDLPYHRHPDGWYGFAKGLVSAMVIQRHLKARDTDVFLATFPKCGTTWIKALMYATLHRGAANRPASSLLAAHSPHQLIPFLEAQVFVDDRIPDLSSLPAPRLLATHIPSRSLPDSVFASSTGCKVVYLCRDPKDCFVSLWHFWNRFVTWGIHDALQQFCDGASLFGPFWEHALGYWRWHVEKPSQVLFLTYEALAADTLGELRRIAGFLGRPFTAEEQDREADRKIVEACRIESLAGLEVNRSGSTAMVGGNLVANKVFFRRGVAGDWKNHLAPDMARRIDEITESKFKGSGLVLLSQNNEHLNY